MTAESPDLPVRKVLQDHKDFPAIPARLVRKARRVRLAPPVLLAHPALSDGRVYFRDEKELICLQMGE